VIPVFYYYNCTSSSYPPPNSNIKTSIQNWFCSFNSTYCKSPLVTGWTELDDCMTGFEYPYCPVNTYCGSVDTCKGPCSTSTNTCVFDNNNYICRLSPTNALNTNWVSSMYFIIAIVIIGFLIVMGIILVFYIFQKAWNPSKQKPNYN
jgi:hypothetical protein